MTNIKTEIAQPAVAKGLNKRNAPNVMRAAALNKAAAKKAKPKAKRVAKGKAPAKAKAPAANTFHIVEYATEHSLLPKSVRALIRRQVKAGKTEWNDLMIGGTPAKPSYLFADNVKTRNQLAEMIGH